MIDLSYSRIVWTFQQVAPDAAGVVLARPDGALLSHNLDDAQLAATVAQSGASACATVAGAGGILQDTRVGPVLVVTIEHAA